MQSAVMTSREQLTVNNT